ncbi:hypothetical protein H0H93_012182, partial [Arthromyces matolae]
MTLGYSLRFLPRPDEEAKDIDFPVSGSICQIIGYTLMAPALQFPALIVAYAINSVGLALQDAQANGFVASVDDNAETKMGILHAVY